MRVVSIALLVFLCACSKAADESAGNGQPAGGGGTSGECTADLQSDGAHCGACGHSCLGGACAGGKCGPVALAQGLERPRALSLAGEHVYFAAAGLSPEGGGVFRIGKTAGQQAELVAGVVPNVRGAPVAVALDSRALFVARRMPDALEKIPLAGGEGTLLWQSASSTTTGSPYAIAIDDTHVHAVLDAGSAVLVSVPKNGGAARGLGTENPWDKSGFFGVTASSGFVIWSSPSELLRIATSGGTVESVLAGQKGDPRGVVLAGETLYWTDWGSYEPTSAGAVLSCPAAACTSATTLASGLYGPLDLAVDATHVWVTVVGRGQKGGSIVKIPREGGEPVVVADGQATPIAIAIDDKAAYWTNGGYNSPQDITVTGAATATGALMRVAK